MKFQNKVAIVAGGARDIGRAISEKLAVMTYLDKIIKQTNVDTH